MNAPGNKLVDDFDVPEMAPVKQAFLDGAHFIYGHTVMQRALGLGYQSEWAQAHLPTRRERNDFYTAVGYRVPPGAAGLARLRGAGAGSLTRRSSREDLTDRKAARVCTWAASHLSEIRFTAQPPNIASRSMADASVASPRRITSVIVSIPARLMMVRNAFNHWMLSLIARSVSSRYGY